MRHQIKPAANFGDLVKVDGYGNNLFAVDSYSIQYHYEPDLEFTEIIYDLTCVYGDSGYIIGEQEEITLACRAKDTDAFIANYKAEPFVEPLPSRSFMDSIYFAIGNGGDDAMQTKKTADEPRTKFQTRDDRINALLDERNVVGAVIFDDIGDMDEYTTQRHAEIDAELKGLTPE